MTDWPGGVIRSHPARWATLTPDERMAAAMSGEMEGTDWRVTRVAHLTGVDPAQLTWHIEAERGWEPHDTGFLHQLVVSARILIEDEIEGIDDWPQVPVPPPANPYNEDGYCRFCGNGSWKPHGLECKWADITEAAEGL